MRKDWIVTKRLLGIALAAAGTLTFIAIFALDILRQHDAIGPTQKLIFAACIGVFLIGLSLIPLGDRPA